MRRFIPYVILILIPFIFFWQFFIKGLLPIPSDTIIGLYHPFRDLYAKDYPRGIPFKNFLITDPVRQQYPWKKLAINVEKNWELPLWNLYNFSGTPLAANFQSAVFYPLNILFFIFPFYLSWSLFILFAPLLAGIFLYLYFQSLELNKWASILGSIAFSFSGFSVSWLEWGNVLHTALWMPLIFLSIDKIFTSFQKNSKLKTQNSKLQFKTQNYLIWCAIFLFSLVSSFFAGHLQIFFYVFIFSMAYFLARWVQYGKIFNILFVFFIFTILFLILTLVQWLPTLQFIFLSGRNLDQIPWQNPGWFIPWQNLIQFIAPDFFGNPATLNYWGIWNYAEFVGYVGIFPIVLALFALFFRHDKKTLFFGTLFFLSLIFSLPTIFAKIPYLLHLSFINTTQPTRLLFITDFCLAVLSAFGFDYFLKIKDKKKIFYSLGIILTPLFLLWIFVLYGYKLYPFLTLENVSVSKNNLILPTIIFIISASLIFALFFLAKRTKVTLILYCILVTVVVFDLFRFGLKFTPFTKKEYLFPQTKSIEFLTKNIGNFRIMTTDSRIFPPNFSILYKLQSIDGYDPLYQLRYAELMAASERGEPNISPPFGFNRIITPHNFESKIINFLGVKYILSLTSLSSKKLEKVFQEGETRVYENKEVLPRVFFVDQIKMVRNKKEAIKEMFKKNFDPSGIAIVEGYQGVLPVPPLRWASRGDGNRRADIIEYSANKVVIKTENKGEGFLVLTDSFYPTWHAKIDGTETKIYLTDFNFRGIIVPKGNHEIEFYDTLL